MISSKPAGCRLDDTARERVLVAGVDEPIEPFGGVLADGQHADVIDNDQVDAGDAADGFGDRVVGAVTAD